MENNEHDEFIRNSDVLEQDNLYCRTGGEGEFPSDQVQRGVIQIESSEEDEHYSENQDWKKSSDDMADADDTVDGGNNSDNQDLDLGYGNRRLSIPTTRSPLSSYTTSSLFHIVHKVMLNQGVQLDHVAVVSENYDADADAQDDISMDEIDNIQTTFARSYARKILKA
jgi:hypothetical protein